MSTRASMLPWQNSWKDYLELCKPRVVLLMLITALVGMYLASEGDLSFSLIFYALTGIGFCAGSAAAINHLVDRHIDSVMARTQKRPIARGRLSVSQALTFAGIIGCAGIIMLTFWVNPLTAGLTFLTLIGYAVIYTGFLKRATPQNIVIGGLAGAAPPLLGWTSVTNHLDPQALLLVLIIFTWTPPHFWALAIYRQEEYRKAKIPMLPVTHGIEFTKLQVLLYTILLILVTLLPFAIGMSGILYLVGAIGLGLRYLYWSIKLYFTDKALVAMQSFRYSIIYLLFLFVVMLVDHSL